MTEKLLVIGWDGADHRHLNQIQPEFWSSLEHKGRLLPEPLYRGIPIDSGTAWTTITTGLEVEDHGIISINNSVRSKKLLSFTKAIAKRISNPKWRTYLYYGLTKAINTKDRTPRSQDVGHRRVWDYIEDSLAMEIPLTYPAWKTGGIMLSGIPAPLDGDQPAAYPLEYEEKRKEYRGYNYLGDRTSPLEDESQPNLEAYRDNIYSYNRDAMQVVREIDRENDLQLIFIVFPLIDDLLHALDPEEDREEIEAAYQVLDRSTEQLVNDIAPDDVLIISDHGMQPAEHSLNPNQYPGLEMDHDPMNGIWASSQDFDLEEQKDVTPAILEYFGKEFSKEPYEIQIEEKDSDSKIEDISV